MIITSKMMQKICCLIFVVASMVLSAIFYSCSSKHDDTEVCHLMIPDVPLPNGEGIEVDSVIFIPLDHSDDSPVLSMINRVEFLDSLIIIQDISGVYVYNQDGKYQFQLGTKGHGRGEYVNASTVFVNHADNTISLIDTYQGKILVYDESGHFLRALSAPNSAFDLSYRADYLSGKSLITAEYMIRNRNSAFKWIDMEKQECKEIASYLFTSAETKEHCGSHPYSIYNNEVRYVLPFDPHIYSFSDGVSSISYEFYTRKKILSPQELEKYKTYRMWDIQQYMKDNVYVGYYDIFELSKYIIVSNYLEYIVIDKTSENLRFYKFSFGDSMENFPISRIYSTKDDFLVSVFSTVELSALSTILKKGSKYQRLVKNQVSSSDEYQTYIILYHFQ